MIDSVAPYLFKGGSALDYVVKVGQAGTYYTQHLATGRTVANVAVAGSKTLSGVASLASFAVDAVPWVNLGVGVLNLGVSVYTAYKVHKLAKQVDRIDQKIDGMDARLVNLGDAVEGLNGRVGDLSAFMNSAVTHLDTVLGHQSMTLALLVDGQGRIVESLELLHREMLGGFRGVREELLSVEARRERADLETHLREVLSYFKHCTAALAAGHDPAAADVRKVVEVACRTSAWIDTRLSTLPVGSRERLPLITARGMALRMEIDGRLLEGTATSACDTDREAFVRMVRQDGRAMAAGATPWELARGVNPLLTQYVLLNRAFTRPMEFGVEDGRGPIALLSVDALRWDDGLGRHRPIFDRTPEREAVEIKLDTLAGRAWYTQWRGLAPGANVPDAIDTSEVAAAIGAPRGWRPERDDVLTLEDLALPRTSVATAQRYERELA